MIGVERWSQRMWCQSQRIWCWSRRIWQSCDFSVVPSPKWTFGFRTAQGFGLGLGVGGLDLRLATIYLKVWKFIFSCERSSSIIYNVCWDGWGYKCQGSLKNITFLAPTGTQEILISVCLFVCLFAVNLHLSWSESNQSTQRDIREQSESHSQSLKYCVLFSLKSCQVVPPYISIFRFYPQNFANGPIFPRAKCANFFKVDINCSILNTLGLIE